MVIDTHTHAWAPPSHERPWVNEPLCRSLDNLTVPLIYEGTELLEDMDETGIEEAVVVGYPITDWRDNSYLCDLVRNHDRLYGIATLDPFAENAATDLQQIMAIPRMLGFRLATACPYEEMWEGYDPAVRWLLDALEEREYWQAAMETGAIVQLAFPHQQIDQITKLINTYPKMTYLVDHFAHASPNTDTDEGTFAEFMQLASHSNVYVKLSGIAHCSKDPYPFTDMHHIVRSLVESFSRENIIWGSDFPNISDVTSYKRSLTWLENVDGIDKRDCRWIREKSFQQLLSTVVE